MGLRFGNYELPYDWFYWRVFISIVVNLRYPDQSSNSYPLKMSFFLQRQR